MILSDWEIKKAVKEGRLTIVPFKESRLQPSSYDLTLADEVLVFDNHKVGVVDVRQAIKVGRRVKIGSEGFVLHPGEFILGSTREYFKLPANLAATLEGRSSLGRLGLIIHATAGYVDPGFRGQLTFEISNISRLPIRIYSKMRIAQIVFVKMSKPPQRLYGDKSLGSKYQGQRGPTASLIFKDYQNHGQTGKT